MNERALKGVVVDAGHGGSDPGAISGNVYEKDFTLRGIRKEKGLLSRLIRIILSPMKIVNS